jgi:hypothetical protein
MLARGNDQGTAAWRQERAGFITGSGFADAIGKRKDGKYFAARETYKDQLVVERLTGIPHREIKADPLDWGKSLEDEARISYELRIEQQTGEPVFVERVPFQEHKSIPWVGTSPDGLVGERGMVEIKCPYDSGVHLATLRNAQGALAAALGGGEVPLVLMPAGYVAQVMGNLWVLEREWCDFVSYDPRLPRHLRLYVSRIYRDDKYIANLEAEVIKFNDEIEEEMAMLLDPKDGFPQPAVPTEGVAA